MTDYVEEAQRRIDTGWGLKYVPAWNLYVLTHGDKWTDAFPESEARAAYLAVTRKATPTPEE